jgi:VCPO second helical-bundle domain
MRRRDERRRRDEVETTRISTEGDQMKSLRIRVFGLLVGLVVVAAIGATTSRDARAALPPLPNTVQQWNKIAEDTVVGSGAFQGEGEIYMSYTAAAVYDAVVAIRGGFEPYGPAISAPPGASVDCAVVEAAYRTLRHYFASASASLDGYYSEALSTSNLNGCTADAGEGTSVGLAAANNIIALRIGDGRLTPIGTTSSFETMPAGPGVWRLTPPFAAPQTPWLGSVQPFLLKSPGQFQPPPPIPLSSTEWVRQFDEVKAYGGATSSLRTSAQTATARFYTANVVRQFNLAARDLATARALNVLDTARLFAMVNTVSADALMTVLNAKYKFLFWRPVTAIDPTAVTADGFGPVPGFDDGNPATAEEPGWRPLVTTPNHPEYPAAHGTNTSAMAEVFSEFLGTDRIDLDIHGFDAAGSAGNLDAVHHFDTAEELRNEVINARLWGGIHYRRSSEAGVHLGREVAHYGLNHAFKPTS